MVALANTLHRFALGNRTTIALPNHPRSGDHWAYARQQVAAAYADCRIRRNSDRTQSEYAAWQSFCKLEG